ncbi:MAG: hypothetical protein CL748_03070 [Chloroflexi bacterium]|nr:hypothetical protein [Chloroflexota bacterium]|tara:strand:- start:214 stop:1056 length:843 start_codon:yes stop_codon:yes gene_type:complete
MIEENKIKDESADSEKEISISINDAFQEFVKQLAKKNKRNSQSDVAKFVRWIGPERLTSSVSPSEIGEYNENFGPKNTSRDMTDRITYTKDFLIFLKKKEYVHLNLATHLRLRKSKVSSKGKSMIASPTIKLTQSGYNEMTKQLAKLQKERIKLTGEIQRAAADGDVRENAPLEAARESQGMTIGKIREIEATLKASVVIDGSKSDTNIVQIGSKLELTEKTTKSSGKYQLVEANEANPLDGKISTVSPLGSAVLGQNVGEEVNVNTPRGNQVYIISKIL